MAEYHLSALETDKLTDAHAEVMHMRLAMEQSLEATKKLGGILEGAHEKIIEALKSVEETLFDAIDSGDASLLIDEIESAQEHDFDGDWEDGVGWLVWDAITD